jgi:methyl-accepting chemotaxis protein
VLQAASEFLVAIERVGRLINEAGTQREIEGRLTPEITRMREAAATVVDTVRRRDQAIAEKLVADMGSLDEVVRDSMIARSNITDVTSLYPSAFASFAGQQRTSSCRFASVQATTRDSVDAIGKIASAMGDISQVTSTIAAAVEEQGAATAEISRNILMAATGTDELSNNVATVTDAIGATNAQSATVPNASDALAGAARRLSVLVNDLLHDVAAA